MSENREKPHWEGKHYSFFQNTGCEYFPCHRIADPARFSCLFCYCPLYMLGTHCGGNFRYTEKGIKDCTGCLIPHLPENYGRITGKYKEIVAAMQKPEQGHSEKLLLDTEGEQETEEGEDSQHSQQLPETEHKQKNEKREVSGLSQQIEKTKHTQKTGMQVDSQNKPTRSPAGRIVLLACTERGFETMSRAASALQKQLPDTEILQTGRCAHVAGFEDGPRLSEAAARWFHQADALLFIAATGIAVRCIAPFVRDKFRDPAVLVMDENGKFVISLLSGHAGGANRLCGLLAEAMGAQPVITTATDGRGLFAVDVFASEKGLQISDRTIAKQISARLLAGEILKIYFEEVSEEPCFDETIFLKYGKGIVRTPDRRDADVIVSFRRQEGDRKEALYLIPRTVTLGIGCRRGISAQAIQKAVRQILQTSGVFRQAVSGIASIDLKKEEAGLHAFAKEWDLPLTFYRAEDLGQVPGTFSSSDFVRNVTGVDCVCERSAVRLAMGHTPDRKEKGVLLLERKQSLDGVTAALALWPYSTAFENT